MLSMNGSGSGSRRLKDRLAWLLRPANSLLRSSCSSSSSTSTFTSISTSSSSTTTSATTARTAADLLPRVQPSSSPSLGLLRHPEQEENKKNHEQKRSCASSRHAHARRRHLKSADDVVMRKLASNPYGFTTTDDGEDTDGSDVDDVETEAFLSARSLASSDSSGFYTSSNVLPKHRHHHRQRPQQTKRRRRRRTRAESCVESSSCRVKDEVHVGFRPVVMAEEELRKGLAVVRRSTDPYGDFRESMVDMIVERQVFGAAELERLLRTYLSLNPTRLHPVILQAFSDIWVVLRGC